MLIPILFLIFSRVRAFERGSEFPHHHRYKHSRADTPPRKAEEQPRQRAFTSAVPHSRYIPCACLASYS